MQKKIYITSLHLQHGGVEMAISLLANALCQQDYEVEILCTYHLGEPVYPLDPRVKITYLTEDMPNRQAFQEAVAHKRPLSILREGIRAVGILRRKKTTMRKAIAHISHGTILSTRNEHTVLLSKYGQPEVRKVAQLHHDHRFDPNLVRDFQKHYGNIDYFVLLVPQLTQEVQEMMRGHNRHTQCLTIGNFLEKDPCPVLPEKKKQIIAVGRLHPDKGFDRLLSAWALIAPQHPDWSLKIVGDGPLSGALQEQCRQLMLERSVTFTGALPHQQVLEEMAQSSLYAMTSISEGFPFVLIEALSCALPIVSFKVRVGAPALIQEGENGFLVPDDDIPAFAKKLDQLMDQPDLRERMGKNAKSSSKQYLQDQIMSKWLSIL